MPSIMSRPSFFTHRVYGVSISFANFFATSSETIASFVIAYYSFSKTDSEETILLAGAESQDLANVQSGGRSAEFQYPTRPYHGQAIEVSC
jgi:hypothetical protein